MRPIINTIGSKETLAVAGDVIKFVVRKATDSVQIRSSVGDVFPVQQGDRVTLKTVSQGLQIYNPNNAQVDIEFILMDGDGAEYESSAGSVEVSGNVSLAPKDLKRFYYTQICKGGDVGSFKRLLAPNPSREKAIVVIKQLSEVGNPIAFMSNSNSGGMQNMAAMYAGTLTDESTDALYIGLGHEDSSNPWAAGEDVFRVTVIEYADYYVDAFESGGGF